MNAVSTNNVDNEMTKSVNDIANMPDLSEEERKQLIHVMERAKEFEEEETVSWKSRNMTEGLLYKYTNVMKGFQHRWFVLDTQVSCLGYYEKIEHRKQKPRGVIYLSGAVVSPSDEDSHQFTVNASNGEVYRLKAQHTKERQFWVDRIRSCIQSVPLVGVESVSMPSLNNASFQSNNLKNAESISSQELNIDFKHFDEPVVEEVNLKQCKHNIIDIKKQYLDLETSISSCDTLHNDILMVKALSYAVMDSLDSCLTMIKANAKKIEKAQIIDRLPSITNETLQEFDNSEIDIDHDKEIENTSKDDSFDSTSTNSLDEDHKSVILGVLGQLKLGMDLTKVSLPSFILEHRSLLETYADCMAHPSMFLSCTDYTKPEDRMKAVVEWYLASFHAVRCDSVAKKPYNPIIGETFHCSWNDPVTNKRNLYCVAEQVSHHPPVSAFYVESPDKKMYLNGSVWTKSKFLGMSIGVQLIGKVQIHILEYGEVYDITLPSVYARSILTKPWVELGDKVNVTCAQNAYSASICFQTKPFYGGKLNKIAGEIRNDSTTICKISGEWNNFIEFNNVSTGDSKVITIGSLRTANKLVRPLDLLHPMESHRLWSEVTESLAKGDIEQASNHKKMLEERQRNQEKYRKQNEIEHTTRYFEKVEQGIWLFKKPLTKEQNTPSF